MQKLLLSLLLSQVIVSSLNAEQTKDANPINSIENTTAENPNNYVTGNIAQLHFNIDVNAALGKKILELLKFCSEIASQDNTANDAAIAELSKRFDNLTEKEKRFVGIVVTATSSLRIATEELIAEYEATTPEEATTTENETHSDNQ